MNKIGQDRMAAMVKAGEIRDRLVALAPAITWDVKPSQRLDLVGLVDGYDFAVYGRATFNGQRLNICLEFPQTLIEDLADVDSFWEEIARNAATHFAEAMMAAPKAEEAKCGD